MMPILLLLLIIIIPGSVAYVYLRQEQDKYIPKDKYEFVVNNSESPKRFLRPNKNTLFIVAGLIAGVLGVKLFMSGLSVLSGIEDGRTGGGDNLSALVLVVPTFLMGAGVCILISLLIMTFLYKDQIIASILAIIKTVFDRIFRLYHKVVTKN